MNSFLFAVHDIRDSFSHSQLWLWTVLQDIKLRYRRSALGPWWLTISTGILVAAMGILYARIFKHTISDYLPNFVVSYILCIFNCFYVVRKYFIAIVDSITFLCTSDFDPSCHYSFT